MRYLATIAWLRTGECPIAGRDFRQLSAEAQRSASFAKRVNAYSPSHTQMHRRGRSTTGFTSSFLWARQRYAHECNNCRAWPLHTLSNVIRQPRQSRKVGIHIHASKQRSRTINMPASPTSIFFNRNAPQMFFTASTAAPWTLLAFRSQPAHVCSQMSQREVGYARHLVSIMSAHRRLHPPKVCSCGIHVQYLRDSREILKDSLIKFEHRCPRRELAQFRNFGRVWSKSSCDLKSNTPQPF